MRADQIRLTGVRAFGHHGVLDHERRDGQEFLVDVVMTVDLRPAGSTDELARTVNYAEVAADVVEVVTGEPRDLIETVAEEIAARTLARPLVEAVEVTVHKPQAPVGVPFGDVDQTLEQLLRWAEDPGRAAELGRRGHELARAELDWAQHAPAFVAALEDAAQGRGGPPGH